MKNFINSKKNNAVSSSFIGKIEVSYDHLVQVFGKETFGMSGDYKVSCFWVLEFSNGTIVTIYDYKTNKKYCGNKKGISKKDNTNWHIGGFDQSAVSLVKNELLTYLK